jgi:hypothetical protein
MLGPRTEELIAMRCPPSQQGAVSELLCTQCAGNLPGVGTSPEWIALIDRVQLATIRGSNWEIAVIQRAVDLTKNDWRDVLVGAGFAHSVTAHLSWQEQALRTGDLS